MCILLHPLMFAFAWDLPYFIFFLYGGGGGYCLTYKAMESPTKVAIFESGLESHGQISQSPESVSKWRGNKDILEQSGWWELLESNCVLTKDTEVKWGNNIKQGLFLPSLMSRKTRASMLQSPLRRRQAAGICSIELAFLLISAEMLKMPFSYVVWLFLGY